MYYNNSNNSRKYRMNDIIRNRYHYDDNDNETVDYDNYDTNEIFVIRVVYQKQE